MVSNAIKYRGDEPPLIEIDAHRDREFWTFSVADSGIGIAPEHAKQVFGLFKRLHGPDSYEGTGVGLAICERVVERYAGEIWVEPRSPRGSTFYFKLPGETTMPISASDVEATAQPALEGSAT